VTPRNLCTMDKMHGLRRFMEVKNPEEKGRMSEQLEDMTLSPNEISDKLEDMDREELEQVALELSFTQFNTLHNFTLVSELLGDYMAEFLGEETERSGQLKEDDVDELLLGLNYLNTVANPERVQEGKFSRGREVEDWERVLMQVFYTSGDDVSMSTISRVFGRSKATVSKSVDTGDDFDIRELADLEEVSSSEG